MARLGLVVFAAFVAAVKAFAPQTISCPNPCPPLPTGKCKYKDCSESSGIAGYFKVNKKAGECGYGDPEQPFNGVVSQCLDNYASIFEGSRKECCTACSETPGCTYWQFVKIKKSLGQETCTCGLCFLYATTVPQCLPPDELNYDVLSSPGTIVGNKCKPPPPPPPPPGGNIGQDPHLVGARGTRFDFSGELDKSFCLIADKNFHVNMLLKGYLDDNLSGATVIQNGKAVRSWIKQVAILWRADNTEHSLQMAVRVSPEVARGNGFLESAFADGERLPKMKVGDELILAGGAMLTFDGYDNEGPFAVDVYRIVINGIAEINLRLRVAQPTLRTATDAEAHFNINFAHMKRTPEIHGVLGQTFRDGEDREKRAVDFTKLVALSGKVHVGAEGTPFLDGQTSDYVTSDILKADCRYATFHKSLALPTELAGATSD